MPREIPVLLNRKARSFRKQGVSTVVARVEEACRAAGLPARVIAHPPGRMESSIREAVDDGAAVVVVGGGDGTIRTAAEVLAETDVALGILPLGNHNHAARDLGLPSDLSEAARVVAGGHVRRVDLGDLDGHAFLNNSCLGIYPYLVRVRDHHERRFQWSRLPALARAAWTTFWRFPTLEVDIHRPVGVGMLRSPLVLVGNNEYSMGIDLGRRSALDRGRLWLCAVQPMGRLRFMKLCLRSVLKPVPREEQLLTLHADEISIRVGRHRAWVSLDGEVRRSRGVLHYRSRPGALQVLSVPPQPASEPVAT